MLKLNKIFIILKIIPKLGYWNVVYTMWYKLSLRYGIRKRWFKIKPPVQGEFYKSTTKANDYPEEWKEGLAIQSKDILSGNFTWFSYHKFTVGKVPNWFYNPFNKYTLKDKTHWTKIKDFDQNIGDIKVIWELSRFDWLTTLSRAYKVFGNNEYLENINLLLKDWSKNNPLNQGANWKCGQEASIRVMNLLSSAHIMDQFINPNRTLQEFIFQHLERIYPNINYAIAQDNNHGVSEAAAMYIASSWLIKTKYKNKKLLSWNQHGRHILEGRIMKLVQQDGTFSQRSMNYHRVMVDTMTFTQQMMNLLKEDNFNSDIKNRLSMLALWQYKLTFGKNGDAPNFGNNDGAMFENLHSCDFRDFRVSTQTIFGMLFQQRAYDNANISEPLYWRLGNDAINWTVKEIKLNEIEILDNQMVIIRKGGFNLLLKNPEDTFRPGNDSFHIDLWYNGENILRDSGTFSYNAVPPSDLFKSVAAHNTIQFGEHEQMPQISRFLNGDWINNNVVNNFKITKDEIIWEGDYTDYRDNTHFRKISLSKDHCKIEDSIISNETTIVRYHLDNTALDKIKIEEIEEFDKELSYFSLYYMKKSKSQMLSKSIINNFSITIRPLH